MKRGLVLNQMKQGFQGMAKHQDLLDFCIMFTELLFLSCVVCLLGAAYSISPLDLPYFMNAYTVYIITFIIHIYTHIHIYF